MSRLGTVGEIGNGKELALEVSGPGPWLIFVQPLDPGAVAPEVDVRFAVPGGGHAAETRAVTPVSGAVVTLPGSGRVVVRDPGALNSAYRVSVAASAWHPPRWGLRPERQTLPPAGQSTIDPPAFAVRGRVTVLAGSLSQPAWGPGVYEIPAIQLALQAGVAGAEFWVDWEGWF